jgi:CRP-like cAMP-binding protein
VRWLRDAGWPQAGACTSARGLIPTLNQWLNESQPELWFDLLPSLADRLCRQLPQPSALTATAFRNAFAHSIVALATDEVAREARRAGHASVFAGLCPHLHSEPSSLQLTDLAATLELSEGALAMALSRLRQRFRERIEAALALWAPSPEMRNTLRRQLRESLIGTESIL